MYTSSRNTSYHHYNSSNNSYRSNHNSRPKKQPFHECYDSAVFLKGFKKFDHKCKEADEYREKNFQALKNKGVYIRKFDKPVGEEYAYVHLGKIVTPTNNKDGLHDANKLLNSDTTMFDEEENKHVPYIELLGKKIMVRPYRKTKKRCIEEMRNSTYTSSYNYTNASSRCTSFNNSPVYGRSRQVSQNGGDTRSELGSYSRRHSRDRSTSNWRNTGTNLSSEKEIEIRRQYQHHSKDSLESGHFNSHKRQRTAIGQNHHMTLHNSNSNNNNSNNHNNNNNIHSNHAKDSGLVSMSKTNSNSDEEENYDSSIKGTLKNWSATNLTDLSVINSNEVSVLKQQTSVMTAKQMSTTTVIDQSSHLKLKSGSQDEDSCSSGAQPILNMETGSNKSFSVVGEDPLPAIINQINPIGDGSDVSLGSSSHIEVLPLKQQSVIERVSFNAESISQPQIQSQPEQTQPEPQQPSTGSNFNLTPELYFLLMQKLACDQLQKYSDLLEPLDSLIQICLMVQYMSKIMKGETLNAKNLFNNMGGLNWFLNIDQELWNQTYEVAHNLVDVNSPLASF